MHFILQGVPYIYCMKFIQGYDRTQVQLFPVSLDQSIDADNEVQAHRTFCG